MEDICLVLSMFSGFNFPFNQSIDGWATPLKNHGVKVSWDDDIPTVIPNMMGKIKAMFQSTNQIWFALATELQTISQQEQYPENG